MFPTEDITVVPFPELCIKDLFFNELKGRADTKWRTHLFQFCLHGDLSLGDLQWRILHRIMPTNSFVSRINADVVPQCLCCSECDTIFQDFCHCSRLAPLMGLLLAMLGIILTETGFVFGCKYFQSWRDKCCLAYFFLLARFQVKWVLDKRFINITKGRFLFFDCIFLFWKTDIRC